MLRKKQGKSGANQNDSPPQHELQFQFVDELESEYISTSLEENKQQLEGMFTDCSDVVLREFEMEGGIPALAVLVDGLVNTELSNLMLQSLMVFRGGIHDIEKLVKDAIPVSQTQTTDTYKEFLLSVLSGDIGILVDGQNKAALLGIRGAEKRSIDEPESESVIRGPKEGFIESLRTNTALIRRKIKSPHLKMKPLVIGRYSNTNIVISYIDGLADPNVVEEVEKRLKKIEIDAILESGYLEEYIQDNAYSPFPQVQYSERPDSIAAGLLQGRVAIITDGTPFVLLVPLVFIQLLQASEDYYERFQIATLIRWLRYLFLIISLTTPALYIAITTYHQELIPTTLLLSIATARESIPFPAVVEALIMEVTFEALREAGIRLPKSIGSAVSMLGALVVGQAAVQAGIVSAPMVIIVSITGIASFTIPRFNGAIAVRMLRFPLMIVASIFGMYGIMICIISIIGHMANLRSFGIPYLSPIAPLSASDLDDTLYRSPWWGMIRRPAMFPTLDAKRQSGDLPKEIQQEGGHTGKNIQHEGEPGQENGSEAGGQNVARQTNDGSGGSNDA